MNSNYKITLSKLYTWTIYLSFIYYLQINLGPISPHLGRLFQFFFLTLLIVYFFLNNQKKIWILKETKLFFLFFVFSLIGLFYTLLSDTYNLSYNELNTNPDYKFRNKISPIKSILLEHLTTIYYFFFFVVLFPYIVKSKENIFYFLKISKTLLFLLLLVGIIDFLLTYNNIFVISKSITNTSIVGNRFHSILGEPRHAIVPIVFFIAVIKLNIIFFKSNNKYFYSLLFFSIICLFLTKSFSFIVAIIGFSICAFFYFFIFYEKKTKYFYLFLLILFFLLILLFIENDPRIEKYFNATKSLWFNLQENEIVPYPLDKQLFTIYPIYGFINLIREAEIIRILFGSGIGTSSLENNYYINLVYENLEYNYRVWNPSSFIVRLIFEHGILGIILYLYIFFKPVLQISKKNFKYKHSIYIFSLLVFCVGLIQKHPAFFAYIGLMYSIRNVYIKSSN